ncbi:serine protein kinase, partial [Penicillium vulpinum]|uniref:serine protein kinase n=1 Tax=Penicillium vulpinum TaxID=29845 RepID=UPI00254776E1
PLRNTARGAIIQCTWATSSTNVWLARDQRLQKDVTLKIVKADASKTSIEFSILLHLSKPEISHPGKDYIINLAEWSSSCARLPGYAIRRPVRWLPGVEIDQSAPKYLMVSQRLYGLLDDADISTLLVKICDLGGAVRNGDNSSVPVTPLGLRAPGLVENLPWDFKIDVWSLGCLIYFVNIH